MDIRLVYVAKILNFPISGWGFQIELIAKLVDQITLRKAKLSP